VLDSDGNRTDYRYDGSGRLDGVWTPNYDFLQFERDGAGRITRKSYPNGVTASYSWNPDNSLQQVSHALGTTILAQSAYGYDGYGSRNALTETLSGLPTLGYGYQYDGLNRLIQVDNGTAGQRENYGYDALGNRVQKQIGNPVATTTAYKYDAANQLTEIHQSSLAGTLLEADLYDGSGNRIKQCAGTGVTRPSNASCTGSSQATQGWNSFGQLSEYAGTVTASYEYDDQGRRIQKTEGAATTHILYDGADIHGEYATPSALPTAVYTFAQGIDKPLSRITGTTSLPGATARYYHEDGLGSLIATTGQTMTPTPDLTTQRFNAWGSKLAGSGTVPTFGYTGREPDITGLMYYRARYYDPAFGRFASRDPIGLLGGVNRYGYVDGSPTNWIDPSGLTLDDVNIGRDIANNAIWEYNFPKTYGFDDMNPGEQAWTLPGLGTYLNSDYLGTLTDAEAAELLDTLIHEAIHYTLDRRDPNQKENDDDRTGFPYDEAKRLTTKKLIKQFNEARKQGLKKKKSTPKKNDKLPKNKIPEDASKNRSPDVTGGGATIGFETPGSE
jgi:RHS repeat-associated protein